MGPPFAVFAGAGAAEITLLYRDVSLLWQQRLVLCLGCQLLEVELCVGTALCLHQLISVSTRAVWL